MIHTIAVSGYRSLRNLIIPLHTLTVITGENGSGKSSLYKAIRLLADISQGSIIRALAHEGGLQSTLWAGPEAFSKSMKRGEHEIQGTVRRNRVALKLGFADEDYGYSIDLGLPQPSSSAFGHDPEIKAEALWVGEWLKPANEIASRSGPSVRVLQQDGSRKIVKRDLDTFDSMMTHAADPVNARELLEVRDRMRRWRFYDHFRTDFDSPIRFPQIGTRTTALDSTGLDLAATIQTIREIGDPRSLDEAVNDAFPGSNIEIEVNNGHFEIKMNQKGLLRPLHASELSDGTIRYLLLLAALLSPRPSPLLVLNEPETSLHPSLLPPLARLIANASRVSQTIVVSHSRVLVEEFLKTQKCQVYELKKNLGETQIEDIESPRWVWPKR